MDSEEPGKIRSGLAGRWDLGESPIQGNYSNFRCGLPNGKLKWREKKWAGPSSAEFGITLRLGHIRLGAQGAALRVKCDLE